MFTRRLGVVIDQLNSGEGKVKEDGFIIAWRERVRQRQEDQRIHIMMLVDGDIKNYNELLQSTCETYLIALAGYVKKIKAMQPKKDNGIKVKKN